MTKLRRPIEPMAPSTSYSRPLRIVASGTLFHTHTLDLPFYPQEGQAQRAQSISKTRGGSASTLLALLSQFPSVETVLVAPLGGNEEGRIVRNDLEKEGVNTRYCKIWKGLGVPSAWVMHSVDNDTRTVINHNPLPDITHEEFVSLLGPLLAPENYVSEESPQPPNTATSPLPSLHSNVTLSLNPLSPAPFEWLHFEGRSIKTTLSNITGIDGLARERKWRSHCVFSVDVGRKGRQGIEALIPQADVLFVNKHYAQHYMGTNSSTVLTPRAFLLSLTTSAAPHALLVAHWGAEGAAALSLPTQEYFQSSGWVENDPPPKSTHTSKPSSAASSVEVHSVRSGSDFWADGRSHTPSSIAWGSPSTSQYLSSSEEDDNDSQTTEVPEDTREHVIDEVGAQDAFVSGMIYALSRRIMPGSPYTPSGGGNVPVNRSNGVNEKWRLDECLRFATELSGRKARRRNWDGLAVEMARSGWFDT